MCSALPLCPVSIKDQKVSESIRKKYLHIGFWRWCKANEGKEKETVVVFIVAVKCFSVLTSKEETLSPQWEIFIFHWRAQWAHLLLISCTFSDRSEAAHSHTSGLSKPQLLYKEHLYYSSWVCVCGGGGASSALLSGRSDTDSLRLKGNREVHFTETHKFQSNLHICAQPLTNLVNYLMPRYDASCFIISIIGTQQAKL